MDQRLHTPWQHKVFTKLIGLQYRIVYKKGVDNRVADALSRRPHTDLHLHAISACQPAWITAVVAAYQQDDQAKALLQRLVLATEPDDCYKLQQGVIRKNGKIWITANSELQHQIIQELHASPMGGHSGVPVTLRRLKQLFAWKGMAKMVHRFVTSCTICQQSKPDRAKYPGLLQPLPVPDSAWQVISMDFIEGLPRSGRFNCILVVVDKFSRYAHFIPLAHPFSAATVAMAFMDNVYKLHGPPEQIISDRDRVFNSMFWRQLFELSGTILKMSSSYHPETDGQTERVNQCLEGYLRCFAHAYPSKWIQWLTLAEYWYNTSLHSALGKSPFEVLYGRSPRQLGITDVSTCTVPDLQAWLNERQLMQDLLRQHLERVRLRMKHFADKNRTERVFATGDAVYLKLQPYIQSAVAPRAHHKLLFKYYGHYTVLQRVGEVAYKLDLPSTSLAYKLDLPSSSRIHPVIHVSQLKKAVGAQVSVQPHLPSPLDILQIPVRVLQRRLHQKGTVVVPQVLVQWSGQPESLATWEDSDELKQRFPRAPAWGQAGSQGGESVNNDIASMGPAAVAQRERRARQESRRYSAKEWDLR
jgi:transposase InsO family protein